MFQHIEINSVYDANRTEEELGVDGYELARQVKKIKPDVKILLTSALECSSSRDITKDLSHLDISGFIEKPISVKEVRNAVLTLINKNTGFHYGPYIHLL
jgi:response regulator RpfG family c-di-GMP phosphodiesterase